MQVTKETWRIRKQRVPGSFFSSPTREPGNEANHCPSHHLRLRILIVRLMYDKERSHPLARLFAEM